MKIRWASLAAAVLAASAACPAMMAQGVIPPGAGQAGGLTTSAAPIPYLAQPPRTPASPFVPADPRPEFAPSSGCGCNVAGAACDEARPRFFTPFMLGDFVGPVANQFSDVKIAEGESPRPVDRVFYKFNYYNNLEKNRWTDPTQPIHNVDLYRNVFGMEKTFFDGAVSLGLRVPFYTLDADAKDVRVLTNPVTGNLVRLPGGPGINDTEFGNVAAVAKAVLWEDHSTGSLISAGATLSFPTAASKQINPGQSILAYAQPYGAFIFNSGDLFIQGFTSVTLPVASAESIVLFTDLGVGYYAYRARDESSLLTAVAPTLELHIADPLRQADPNVNVFGFFDGVRLHNVVDFTFGSTFEFSNRATLGAGVVLPVTGPRPFDVEAIAQLNYRF